MKKFLILALLGLTGCFEKKPKCSDEIIVNTAIKVFKDIIKSATDPDNHSKIDNEMVVKIKDIKPTTEVRKDFYYCEGTMTFDSVDGKLKGDSYFERGSPVKWTIQKLDNGKGFYVELLN